MSLPESEPTPFFTKALVIADIELLWLFGKAAIILVELLCLLILHAPVSLQKHFHCSASITSLCACDGDTGNSPDMDSLL
jgi:hypothetical protein